MKYWSQILSALPRGPRPNATSATFRIALAIMFTLGIEVSESHHLHSGIALVIDWTTGSSFFLG